MALKRKISELEYRLDNAETRIAETKAKVIEVNPEQSTVEDKPEAAEKPESDYLTIEEKLELRRQGLLVDLYLTGTNAVTEDGVLVNLDMIGNRVGAITFGPKKVVVFVGRNKIVPDLEAAMWRIKDYSAPANAMRLDCKTPCVETSECADCSSPGRICNSWTVTEKSFPKGRITVVLINEELGL